MSSREQILGRLRQGLRPFPAAEPPDEYLPVVPLDDTSPAALEALFLAEARKAACVVHEVATPAAAIETILGLVGAETVVSGWDPVLIPLPGLADALVKAHISLVGPDAGARVGLTGIDAALAATGSIVLAGGRGRPRAASLLPPVHIAVVAAGQVMPDLESWLARQHAAGRSPVRLPGNIVVITGPSRTADIAMQLVMGMHGPLELHLVYLSEMEAGRGLSGT